MMSGEGEGVLYLRQMFPRITDANNKEDIFVDSQIVYIINEMRLKDTLVGPKKITRKAFKDVTENFLGNY